MGKMKQGSSRVNPVLAMILRWFVVVPSMLLICLFCVWTACALVAFTLFSQSQHCTGQECKPAVASSRVLLTRALNTALPEQLSLNLGSAVEEIQDGQAATTIRTVSKHQEVFNGIVDVEEQGQSSVVDRAGDSSRGLADEANSVKLRKFRKVEQSKENNSVKLQDLDINVVVDKVAEASEGNTTLDELHESTRTEGKFIMGLDVNTTQEELPEPNKAGGKGMASFDASMEEVEGEERRIIGQGLQNVMQRLREYSSSSSSSRGKKRSCAGKWIYRYRLPSKFNSDLVSLCDSILPWYSLCEYFENSGLGRVVTSHKAQAILKPPGRWHQTNQYMLEIVFDARLAEYECLTENPEEASLFYIPYYGGIDVFRNHYANVTFEKKDELGRELVRWLEGFKSWKRHGGRDHFLVLGKITWDFRRTDTDWGNTLLLFPELQNISKLLIERDPWHENDIGVPHPTFFHPQSDKDLETWLSHVQSSRRDRLVSFAGMPRTTDNIRSVLIEHCLAHPALCRFLECSGDVCFRPEATMHLFLRSHFCLQPVGDSATRRSVFDSLIAGCIPVLLNKDTAYVQYPWHLPRRISSYSVYIPSEDVKAGKVDVVRLLARISREKRQEMRQIIVEEVIPKLVYFAPGSSRNKTKYEDAFDVSIRSLLEKSRRVQSGQ